MRANHRGRTRLAAIGLACLAFAAQAQSGREVGAPANRRPAPQPSPAWLAGPDQAILPPNFQTSPLTLSPVPSAAGAGQCSPPALPPCANAATTYAAKAARAACKAQYEALIAKLYAYRQCMDDAVSGTIAKFNSALNRLKCDAKTPTSCLDPER